MNQTAYKHMPLDGALERQRERLFAKMTHYAEIGSYSVLVTKDVGLRGPFWHICIRDGSHVLNTDVHYAGPDHAQRRGADMLAKLCGVTVQQSEVCDGVNVVGTVSYKTGHAYSDGKEQSAIAYTINGERVMSLPARLNGGRVPDLDECADILAGWSVEDSDGWRFRARDLHELARSIVADAVQCWPGAHVGAALTVTGDGTTEGVKYVMWSGKRSHTLHAVATSPLRLYTHWRGFLDNCAAADAAPRVDLSKPAAAPHVASVLELPQEPNLSVLERVAAQLRARRLSTVPAVVEHDHDEPGDPCKDCGACLYPDQSDMCDDCRQIAPSVVNLYMCPLCKHEWRDAWIAIDSDDCPNCGAKNVEPYDSEHDE
jgi:hypothetical protein